MMLRHFLLGLECLRGSRKCLAFLRRSGCCDLRLFLDFYRRKTLRFGCLVEHSMRLLFFGLCLGGCRGLLPLFGEVKLVFRDCCGVCYM